MLVSHSEQYKAAFKAAFPLTLPVLAGFLFLGLAYGILMQSIGLGAGWTFLVSFLVFAGSMQYVALTLFIAPFDPLNAFAVTLMVNARHLFYGFSLFDKLRDTGKLKPYLVFALCDETFSLLYSQEAPSHVDPSLFMFFIAFLVRWYWILGSILGALLGNFIPFSTEGLDFALTAMFFVIFLEQWERKENRPSLLLGVLCSLLCLLIFGAASFMIPTMFLLLLALSLVPKRLVRGGF